MLPISKKSSSFCSKHNRLSNNTEKSDKENTFIQNHAMLDESIEKVPEKDPENIQKIFSNIGEV